MPERAGIAAGAGRHYRTIDHYGSMEAVMQAQADVGKPGIDREEVFEIIKGQLSEILEVDPGTIKESSSFEEDLEADSLALIELVEALEEELGDRVEGFRIADEDIAELVTIRDAIDYVVDKIGAS